MSEIKDCPFCGVTSLEHDDGDPMLSVVGMGRRSRVLCAACGGAGPAMDKEEEAIEAWNRRVVL